MRITFRDQYKNSHLIGELKFPYHSKFMGKALFSIKADGKNTAKWLALGIGVTVFIILYVLWPYQHWQFANAPRSSVLLGWEKVLMVPANGEWQFCFVVPLLVGFLIYRKEPEWSKLPLEGSWTGAPWVFFGAIFFWLGYKVDTGYLGFASIQAVTAGLILMLGGKRWMSVLFFPWLFLLFAWPFFPLDNLLAARLKIPTAQAAAMMLRLFGVDTIRDGSVLQSGAELVTGLAQGARFKLEVSDSCSGMRSLYSLIMVSALYGHIALRRSAPKLVLFLSAVPMAVFGNVVRLLMLAYGSMWFGPEFAVGKQNGDHLEESAFHLLAGFVVFGVALGGMFALATLMEGKHWNKAKLKKSSKATLEVEADSEVSLKRVATLGGGAIALAAIGLLLCWTTPEKQVFAGLGMRAELPETLNDYISKELDWTAKERQNFDEGVELVRRIYGKPGAHQIHATLVLSGQLKKTLHEPTKCLPDAGWIISSTDEITIPLDNGRVIEAAVMYVFRDHEKAPGVTVRLKGINLYWYEGAEGVSTPSYMASNYYSYRDAIFKNLNHRWGQAAFFMPVSERDVGLDDPLESMVALEELKVFVASIAPKFLLVGPK